MDDSLDFIHIVENSAIADPKLPDGRIGLEGRDQAMQNLATPRFLGRQAGQLFVHSIEDLTPQEGFQFGQIARHAGGVPNLIHASTIAYATGRVNGQGAEGQREQDKEQDREQEGRGAGLG
jgi:hypothetical protein